MNGTGRIRICSAPDGEGYESATYPLAHRRSNFIGCEFPLADLTTVRQLDAEFFSRVEIAQPETYAVAFDDVITGLRASSRFDCADYLVGLSHRPVLIRFPVACAELISA